MEKFKTLTNKSFGRFADLFLLTLILLFGACSKKDHALEEETGYCCVNPYPEVAHVFLVPLDGVTDSRIKELKQGLKDIFAYNFNCTSDVFEILPRGTSPETCMNDMGTRLSAKKMIKFLHTNYADTAKAKTPENSKWYVIGVTDRDIATDIHGSPDYGILGLTYLGGTESIISTRRLKNKKDLWKLALHEYCHGFFRSPHCPNDDPTCIMQDAKGHNPHFEKKYHLCSLCDQILD